MFDLNNSECKELPNMNKYRSHSASIVLDEMIYVTGGGNGLDMCEW